MSGVTITVLAGMFAVAATVLAFVFLVPEKKRAALNSFWKLVHDVINFKSLLLELILKASYIFSTAFIILYGFFTIFGETYSSYWYSRSFGDNFLKGLLIMVLGPIAIRLGYELIMMFIILVKNVTDINKKIVSPESEQAVKPEPVVNTVPSCPNCDKPINTEDAFCIQCGTKLK